MTVSDVREYHVVVATFAAGLLAVYFLAKYAIYWTAGVWVSSVDVIFWRAKGLQLRRNSVLVKLRSLRVRINLFDSHHKLINFIAEGLSVEFAESVVAPGAAHAGTGPKNDRELLNEYLKPISLYPRSHALQFLLRHATMFIPSIDLKIKDTEVSIRTTPIRARIADMEFSTDYNVHKNRSVLKFVTDAKVLNITLNYGKECSELSNVLYVRVRGLIDLREGIISNLITEFKSFSLRIPVLTLIRCYVYVQKYLVKTKHPERPALKRTNASLFSRNVCMASLAVNLVKENSIRFDDVVFEKIPLLSAHEMENLCDDDFLAKSESQFVFLRGLVKSVSATYAVLRDNNAGYDIHFMKDDHPFQLVLTIMQAIVQLDLTHSAKPDAMCDSTKYYELVNIPSITFSSVTNILYQMMRKIEEGNKYTDSLLNYNCSISNPIVDISTDQLAVIITRFKQITFDRRMHQSKRETSTNDRDLSKLEYFYYLSSIWPQINLKLLIERPTVILKTRSDNHDTISMAVLNVSLINIGFATTKKLDFEEKLHYYLKGSSTVSDLTLTFLKKSIRHGVAHPDSAAFDLASDQNIIKANDVSIKVESRLLPESKVACYFDYESFALDLSDLVILNGLCEILTDLDDNVTHWTPEQLVQLKEHYAQKPTKKISEIMQAMVFRDLPEWFDKVKLGGKKLKIVTGSRSVLIPAEIINQLTIPNIIDTLDGSLRKVSLTVADWHVEVNNNKVSSVGATESSQTQTTKDSNSDDETSIYEEQRDYDEYWKIAFGWRNAQLKAHVESAGQEDEFDPYSMRASVIAKLPNVSAVLRSTIDSEIQQPRLSFESDCSAASIHYSLMAHFLILSSFHLLNNTLFKPVYRKYMKIKKLRKEATMDLPKESSLSKIQEVLQVLHVQINIEQFGFVCHFAEGFKIKLDGLRSGILLQPGAQLKIRNNLFRLLVDSPTSPGYWTRFLSVNNSKVQINIHKMLNKKDLHIDEMGTLIEVMNTGCRISIPHQFIVHSLFDQISVAFKTMKQLHHSLKFNNNEIVIYPHAMKAPRVPKIKVKSKRFIFKMDDDPFESELNMIFQLGAMEQRRRLEKHAHFKQKLKDKLSEDALERHLESRNFNTDGLLESSAATKHIHSYSFTMKERNSTEIDVASGKFSNNKTVKQAVNKIDELDKKLFIFRKHLSRSWIELVRDYRLKMDEAIEANGKFIWALLKQSSYPPNFNHRLLDYPSDAALMSVILENVDLTIKSPTFPLEKVPEYIHDIGKGVPLDTDYTILIPVHVDLRVKELRMHLRDYPLPLCYIPKVLPEQDQTLAALRICGNFIITEELDERIENIRTIYVPLVPMATKAVNDQYFALDVPKTIASVKLYTNLAINVNSLSATKFTWGQSYQPAIQQIILNFDDFTKPQLDPSEKVGFWDKVRSILHARIAFKWAPEGELVVSLKGGRDPYSLSDTDAGFLLGFKKNITLDINKDDDPKEFLCVKSGEMSWSVANHLALPLLVWFKESSESIFVPDLHETYYGFVAGCYLETPANRNLQHEAKMSQRFVEKNNIRLRGDVKFKIGLSFETEINGERTHDSIPHYKIKLSNPKCVEDKNNYDAYAGFRSKYAHLSISLSSPSDVSLEKVDPLEPTDADSYNVLHLSPKSFTQFFAWWKMFSGNMQLPVRHGALFGPNKTSKKFSEVLSTLQFQFLIAPLYISHIYREDFDSKDERLECVGLKAKADSFTVDLHQRKEAIVNKYSELDKTKSIQKMKMYLGEVDVSDVDLRAVRAVFRKNKDAKFEEGDGILDSEHHINHSNKNIFYTFDSDETWLDYEDFDEVSMATLANYRSLVKIYPVLFTPRFTYLRQLDHTIPRGVIPADNELAHDCVLGTNKFVETQRILLEDRLAELEAQLMSTRSQQIVNNLNKGIKSVKKLLETISSDHTPDDLADDDTERGFNNKFLIHNVQVKYNKDVRDIVFKYTHLMTMRRAILHYLRYQSFAIVQKIIRDQKIELENEDRKLERFQTLKSEYLEEHHTRRDEFTYDDISCSDRLAQFDDDLRSVINSSFRSSDDYLIKFISPQIQLSTNDVKSDTCVLVTSPEIELKIVSIKQASSFDEDGNEIVVDNEDAVLEKRYGALFKDANIFVVHKRQVVLNALSLYSEDSYGSTSKWPPWIGVELCYDGESLNDNMILQKTSLVFRYDQLRELIRKTSFNDRKRIILDIPKVVTSCDSTQYFAFYDMVLNLLMYKEPSDTLFHERLTSLILTTDFTDLDGVRNRIRGLQLAHSTMNRLSGTLSYKQPLLTQEEEKSMKLVTEARADILSEIFLLMRLVSKGTTAATVNKDEELEWTIRADDITVHMLDQNRKPFIDANVKNASFRRIEESSNSNTNIVQVNELNAYNLAKNAMFPEVIAAYQPRENRKKKDESKADQDSDFIIEWAMDKPVGGIKVIRSVVVNMIPLKISMEQNTGEKLFDYLFPPTADSSGPKKDVRHANILTLNNQVKHDAERSYDSILDESKEKLPEKLVKRSKTFSSKLGPHKNDSDSSANSSSDASTPRTSLDSSKFSVMKHVRSNSSSSSTVASNINTTPTSTTSFNHRPDPQYVSEMISRASTFMSIVALTINSFVLNISFRGEGKYRLINVSGLTLNIPKLQFQNKIWTIEDLFNHIKKLVLKALLSHSGVILANKLTHHKKTKRTGFSEQDELQLE